MLRDHVSIYVKNTSIVKSKIYPHGITEWHLHSLCSIFKCTSDLQEQVFEHKNSNGAELK